jgi:hypothetical protein
VKPPAQVFLVRLDVGRVALAELLLLLAGELQPERLRDLPRDLFLHRDQVGRLLPESLAPEL